MVVCEAGTTVYSRKDGLLVVASFLRTVTIRKLNQIKIPI